MGKSQTSTEYLVILAVVIIIALVAINTLGGFPGIGSNNNKKVSDFKLSSDTIGIESYSIGVNFSLFKIKNNYFDTITVTEFRVNQQANLTCNSSNTIPALPIVLNVGESKLINCSAVNSSNYAITNKQTPVLGISYIDPIGATRTAGNVQSYAAVNSSSENGSQGEGQPYVPSSTVLSLRNGLVAYYPFDGNESDLSGNGNDGTNNGGVIYTQSGKVGGAYSFDGSDDYLDLGTNIRPSNISISTWIYWTGGTHVDDFYGVVYNQMNGHPWDQFCLMILHSDFGKIDFGVTDGVNANSYLVSNNAITQNAWHHVVVTWNGTTQVIYIDGTYDNSINVNLTMGTGSYPVYLGTNHPYLLDTFAGTMDEVAIWNRALNSTEVAELYNSSNGLSLSLSGAQTPVCQVAETNCSGTEYLTCSNGNWVNAGHVAGECGYYTPVALNVLRTGLVGYWPLDGNTSDLSGNGNNGNNYGAIYTSSGKVGGAYDFNGNNEYFIASDTQLPLGTSSRTYAFWAKFNDISKGYNIGIGYGASGYGQNIYMGLRSPSNIFVESYAVGTAGGSASLSNGEWYYLVFTAENPDDINDYRYYINGIEYSNPDYGSLSTVPTGSTGLTIGGGDSNGLDGLMDEVAIWNRSLSSNEIYQLYNSSNGFSLSLSGSQAPICAVNQTSCNGTSYLNCSNGNWVNNGNVSGQCGYTAPGNFTAIRTGLISYYTGDNNANDYSGRSNNAAWTIGSASYNSSGKINQSFYFNGQSEVSLTMSGMPSQKIYSVSVWAKADRLTMRNGQMFGWGHDWSSDTFALMIGGADSYGDVLSNQLVVLNGYWKGTGYYLNDLNWHNYVAVADNTNLYVYVDGVKTPNNLTVDGTISSFVHLGHFPGGYYRGGESGAPFLRYYYGSVDEALFWNRTLNTSEIAQLYNSGNGLSLN